VKALSVRQPHASLIAIRAKGIETRGWYTKYRGPLVIHAAKAFPQTTKKLCWIEPFRAALLSAGYKMHLGDLPLGAVITTCKLKDVMLIGEKWLLEMIGGLWIPKIPLPEEPERSFGDYTPGRFAWILEDVEMLPEPIPAKGQLSLWTIPPEIEVKIKNAQSL